MSDIELETYKVNVRSGVVHVASGGRTMERCNVDDAAQLVEVATLEEIGGVTRRKVRFCRWCAPETVR